MSASPHQRLFERAQAAYDNGNYASARSCIDQLLSEDAPTELADKARQLLVSINADPVAKYLFAACLAFFAIVVWAYFK